MVPRPAKGKGILAVQVGASTHKAVHCHLFGSSTFRQEGFGKKERMACVRHGSGSLAGH
jgi:hypothetical protein